MGLNCTVYPGVHLTGLAAGVPRCMISVNILERRRSDFEVRDWIMDSGAFTRLAAGRGHMPMQDYAALANRWASCGNLQAVVSQDFMCESFVLDITGRTVAEHQAATTDRFLRLRDLVTPYLMPVVQGYAPEEYAEHAEALSRYLNADAWVGVGSVCKRQGRPDSLAEVLEAVHSVAPRWRLHGFGVKATSIASPRVSERLATVDSMAWSFAARWRRLKTGTGPGANDITACHEWLADLEAITPVGGIQVPLQFG